MDDRFEAVLARYRDRIEVERGLWESLPREELWSRRDEFLLSVGEEAARLLHALAVGRRARRIVELGTSYGYSTLFLADAARRTGGKVVTFELAAEKQEYARSQLEEAGLARFVEWRLGDAVALLKDEAGPIDFVLIDLWKDLYTTCLELLYPKLAENAVIAADNMLSPKSVRPQAEEYRRAVRAKGDLLSVLLPIGQGIEISCLWRGGVDGAAGLDASP
jgi:predicted O-methyltransferase YrrM